MQNNVVLRFADATGYTVGPVAFSLTSAVQLTFTMPAMLPSKVGVQFFPLLDVSGVRATNAPAAFFTPAPRGVVLAISGCGLARTAPTSTFNCLAGMALTMTGSNFASRHTRTHA